MTKVPGNVIDTILYQQAELLSGQDRLETALADTLNELRQTTRANTQLTHEVRAANEIAQSANKAAQTAQSRMFWVVILCLALMGGVVGVGFSGFGMSVGKPPAAPSQVTPAPTPALADPMAFGGNRVD